MARGQQRYTQLSHSEDSDGPDGAHGGFLCGKRSTRRAALRLLAGAASGVVIIAGVFQSHSCWRPRAPVSGSAAGAGSVNLALAGGEGGRCHTTVFGEECYTHVLWLMQQPGMQRLPSASSLEEMQELLHHGGIGACPVPCKPDHASGAADELLQLQPHAVGTSQVAAKAPIAPAALPAAGAGGEGCSTAAFESVCYKRVMWVLRNGVVENHPEYANLTIFSSFEEAQSLLHELGEANCSRPCTPALDPSEFGPMPLFRDVKDTSDSDEVDEEMSPYALGGVCNIVVTPPPREATEMHPVWPFPNLQQNEKCFRLLEVMDFVSPEDFQLHRQRNWCWAGLKEYGCHRRLYDHLSWDEMRDEALASAATLRLPFEPLRNASLCDRRELGGTRAWSPAQWNTAIRWFEANVQVYVLTLESSVERRALMKQRLHALQIDFEFSDGVDMRRPGALAAAQEEGLVPAGFNFSRAEANALEAGMGTLGGITGTVGCAAGHFRAQRRSLAADPQRRLLVVFEDDVSPEYDFVPRLWRLVTQELPCDWDVVSLNSRCPFGTCVGPHLTRVQPDANEPAERCRHGVNYGFQGVLYRTSEIKRLQEVWMPIVFDERRPRCLDVDVALASISDQVAFYAVPAVQNPGFLHELPEGSSRVEINFQKFEQAQEKVVAPSANTTTSTTSSSTPASTSATPHAPLKEKLVVREHNTTTSTLSSTPASISDAAYVPLEVTQDDGHCPQGYHFCAVCGNGLKAVCDKDADCFCDAAWCFGGPAQPPGGCIYPAVLGEKLCPRGFKFCGRCKNGLRDACDRDADCQCDETCEGGARRDNCVRPVNKSADPTSYPEALRGPSHPPAPAGHSQEGGE